VAVGQEITVRREDHAGAGATAALAVGRGWHDRRADCLESVRDTGRIRVEDLLGDVE